MPLQKSSTANALSHFYKFIFCKFDANEKEKNKEKSFFIIYICNKNTVDAKKRIYRYIEIKKDA